MRIQTICFIPLCFSCIGSLCPSLRTCLRQRGGESRVRIAREGEGDCAGAVSLASLDVMNAGWDRPMWNLPSLHCDAASAGGVRW